ncbi:nucleolin isoform X2 [Molossus molossus]|nr:nucleolin isoform X2 [Molossus molossus]XP_036109382.1 nucleolin isoform X2 [Molossus molossus]XP_036109383.1 nucleolin isoform X2 [Molossus molossus]XP_036109384.1 nucleolin isoform X2 [Molossus molossus]KAF6450732.1 nucleolin [Molossus molossus]
MAPPPKEVEEDSEDEEMSDDEEDESSGEEVVIPQKKGKKATTTPAKKVMVSPTKKIAVATPGKKAVVTPGKKAVALPTPGKKAAVTPAKAVATPGKKGGTPGKALVATPGKKGAATPAKGAKNGKNAKKEDSDEEDDDDSEEGDEEDEDEDEDEFEPTVMKAAASDDDDDEDEDEDDDDDDDEEDDDDEDDSEEEPMEITPAKGKKAPAKAVPVKAKSTAEEEDEEDDDDEEDDEEDEEDEEEEDEEEEDEDEEEEEEEPVKEAPGKRKKEMAKQKAAPEAKKQKVEATEPTTAFNLFVGNLNFSKSAPELKTGISDVFAKNDLAVVDVRIGVSRKFGYVDFESAEDLEKALELTGLKVFGNEIKLEKPKGKDSKKDRDARTLLAKNLPYKVTQDELKEVFEDAMEIRLVSKDGKSKGIAYIEFKTEADAEKTLEEKQGTEIDGRSISLYYTGEKGQSQDYRGGKNSTWSGESKTLVLSNLSYSATEETLQEVFEKATFIKVPQNQNGKSKGYAFIEFASFEDAKEALNSCNKREIEGRAIRLELQGPRGSPNARSQPSKTLFVKGLSEETTEETLKESFDGSVRARIVTDRETGSSKGFGFVDFNSEEDAKAAKEAMEDGEIDGNKVTLDWAKPKGEGGFGGRGGGRGGFGGRGGGRGGRGGFGGRGRGGFGGRGGFRGGRGGGGDHKPQGKKTKFE